MTTYRTGGHWGVTIVREGTQPPDDSGRRPDDELVAVVTNGDRELAERIAALLNGAEPVEERVCGAPYGSGEFTCKRPAAHARQQARGRWPRRAGAVVVTKRPWLCRQGFHKLRWERAELAGYWQLMCQRPTCRSMQCFTDQPVRRLGKGLPS